MKPIALFLLLIFTATLFAATPSGVLIADVNSMSMVSYFDEGELEVPALALSASFLYGFDTQNQEGEIFTPYIGIAIDEAIISSVGALEIGLLAGSEFFIPSAHLLYGVETQLFSSQTIFYNNDSSSSSTNIFQDFNFTGYFGTYADFITKNRLSGKSNQNRMAIIYTLGYNYASEEEIGYFTYGLKARIEYRGRAVEGE